MALVNNLFQDLSTEETGQTMLLLLAAILEKLPRIDANDRVMVNQSEVAPATTPVSGSLTAVTTVSTVAGLSSIGASLRPADAIPMHIGNAGAMHLYNNIIVS